MWRTHAIIPLDFSRATGRLAAFAPELALFGVQRITLLHVLEIRYPRAPEIGHKDHYLQRMAELTRSMESSIRGDVYKQVCAGDATIEILDTATRDDPTSSFIAMTSHGHSRLGEALLGSVTSAVVDRSPVPILVLPTAEGSSPKEQERRGHRPGGHLLDHLLFATDLSDDAHPILQEVARMALSSSRITLLHVRHPEGGKTAGKHKDGEEHQIHLHTGGEGDRLQSVGETLKERTEAQEVDWLVEEGKPELNIVDTARSRAASLIIMGRRHRGRAHGSKELIRGRIIHQVIRHAPVPVLIIPSP